VRELCDNALDAGATEIEVFLEQGGRSLIRIVDDGCGMERDDALLALERHATSKIISADDLTELTTRGFRGEAIPSIAAVSRLEVTTRTKDSPIGTHLGVDAGVLRIVKEVTAPVGTTVSVRSLFFNTPVRRRFIRSPAVEEQRVLAWLLRFAYGVPEVRLRFVSDGRELLSLPTHVDCLERARYLLKGDLKAIEYQREGITVRGLVGHPGTATASAESCVALVNGRPVSDRGIFRAIREGFQNTLKDREVPIAVVLIEMEAAAVDVNVHPQKSEVRFAAPQRVWGVVREGVSRAVTGFGMVFAPSYHSLLSRRSSDVEVTVHTPQVPYESLGSGQLSLVESVPQIRGATTDQPWRSSAPMAQLFEDGPSSVAIDSGNLAPQKFDERRPEMVPRFSELRYIGQAMRCYLLCEHGGSLYVVDMHAAHERINYNKIRAALRGRPIGSQELLFPEPITVGALGVRRLLEHQNILEKLGCEVEQFGPEEVVVRALPPFISPAQARAVLLDIVEYCGVDDDREVSAGAVDAILGERLDRLAARMACHASVRGGDELSREAALALLAALDDEPFAGACPHGRPVIARFGKREVEAWFGRDR
jgi:DNA mismatch repair protein MutL